MTFEQFLVFVIWLAFIYAMLISINSTLKDTVKHLKRIEKLMEDRDGV